MYTQNKLGEGCKTTIYKTNKSSLDWIWTFGKHSEPKIFILIRLGFGIGFEHRSLVQFGLGWPKFISLKSGIWFAFEPNLDDYQDWNLRNQTLRTWIGMWKIWIYTALIMCDIAYLWVRSLRAFMSLTMTSPMRTWDTLSDSSENTVAPPRLRTRLSFSPSVAVNPLRNIC